MISRAIPSIRSRRRDCSKDTSLFLTEDQLVLLLRWGACCCFWGWAWQHLRWSTPYREILWNPAILGSVVEWFGLSWKDYVSSLAIGRWFDVLEKAIGVVHLVLGILCLTVRPSGRWRWFVAGSGSLLLGLLAYCKYLGSLRQWAQWIEYGSQVLIPVILVLALSLGVKNRWTIRTTILAIILTFLGHGAYAVGIFPVPGSFTAMVMNILHVDESFAMSLLSIAGWLDFAVCIAILFPWCRGYALAYATVWGLATAVARPLAGMRVSYDWWGADQYVHEMIYRVPHFALPIFLFFALQKR